MSDQHSQLDLLDALLAHEEAEMLGRTQHHLCDPEMRRICETRRRVYADVRSMIAALMSGERPGAGGFSRGCSSVPRSRSAGGHGGDGGAAHQGSGREGRAQEMIPAPRQSRCSSGVAQRHSQAAGPP